MSWEDRLQEAKYTAPSGAEFVFIYEDVSVEFEKKGTVFNFPDANGSYVQDLGHTGRRYPLQFIYSGPDYDLTANDFEAAIKETGVGRLDHPIYGSVDVVPMGTYSRSDKLKSGGNECVISITLFDTIGAVYPLSQDDGNSIVRADIEVFKEAQAEEFEEELELLTEADKVSFKSRFLTALDVIKSGFSVLTNAQKAINDKFLNVYNSINGSIDFLIATPSVLAFQTSILLLTPGRLAGSLEARLNGYKNIIDSFISGDGKIQESAAPGTPSNITGINNFKNDDLYSSSAIAGYADSVINWTFETKVQALEVAEEILEIHNQHMAWREANYDSLGLIDTGGSYQALQKLVADTAGYLIQISFTLKQEIFLVLDRDRNYIELCAELYNSVEDDTLNFFIDSNNLAGDEYFQLPKGRSVVFYK